MSIIAIIIVALVVVIICVMLSKRKSRKANSQIQQNHVEVQAQNEAPKQTVYTCPFCSTVVASPVGNCPSCGGSLSGAKAQQK